MLRFPRLLPLVLLAACAPARSSSHAGSAMGAGPLELAELHERYRVPAIDSRRFTHQQLWDVLTPMVDGSRTLVREEIGRSAEGRAIQAVTFGHGPTQVLLWSQMHGDESTATMSLVDIFRYLSSAPDDPRLRELAERLTITFVPMLNPDGAERFQRRNAYGIDVNRDARMLVTPEGRALKALHTRLQPDFGFNLHDQNVRTRVGDTDRLAAIALLAPAFDEARSDSPGRTRAKQVAAVVRAAVEPLVEGHVAKYDDTFNPRAFGDLIQTWGTSAVLIESGGWRDDPEKQYLRKVNFVAILSALDAIATGSYALADPAAYESLPENGSSVNDVLIRGGHVVMGNLPPLRADLTVNFADALARTRGRIMDVGDMGETAARDTLDVSGLFLHPLPEALTLTAAGAPALGPGAPASFVVRRGVGPGSEEVLLLIDGRVVRGDPRMQGGR